MFLYKKRILLEHFSFVFLFNDWFLNALSSNAFIPWLRCQKPANSFYKLYAKFNKKYVLKTRKANVENCRSLKYETFYRKRSNFQDVWRQSSVTKCTWTLTSNDLQITPFPMERNSIKKDVLKTWKANVENCRSLKYVTVYYRKRSTFQNVWLQSLGTFCSHGINALELKAFKKHSLHRKTKVKSFKSQRQILGTECSWNLMSNVLAKSFFCIGPY